MKRPGAGLGARPRRRSARRNRRAISSHLDHGFRWHDLQRFAPWCCTLAGDGVHGGKRWSRCSFDLEDVPES